jgi:CBS domain containing-hemolysin-like protein
LAGLFLCLVFSALFSASETAITSLSAHKVVQLIEANPFWAYGLRIWQRNHVGVLTTILIGNTFVSILAGAIATDLGHQYSPVIAVPIAVGAMTFVLLIGGEIAPKTLARTYAERMAIPAMNIIAVVHFLIFPLTWLITRLIRVAISTFGGQVRANAPVTEEDIEAIITLGQRQGTLDKDKQRMLSSIFEFTDTTAREIMVPRTDLVAIAVDTPLDEVIRICADTEFSRIPVYDESIDKVAGVFYAKDLIRRMAPEERANFVRQRMRPAVFIPESKKISELLKQFQQERVHMAIVVNEFGGTEGIVTLEDVIEELLGEIRDEFDDEERLLTPLAQGGYSADARVHLEDLALPLKIEFPADRDYDTLGGFLMKLAGEVPEAGWQAEHGGFRFAVTQADVNRVIRVRITRVPPAPPEGDAEARPASAGAPADEPPRSTG